MESFGCGCYIMNNSLTRSINEHLMPLFIVHMRAQRQGSPCSVHAKTCHPCQGKFIPNISPKPPNPKLPSLSPPSPTNHEKQVSSFEEVPISLYSFHQESVPLKFSDKSWRNASDHIKFIEGPSSDSQYDLHSSVPVGRLNSSAELFDKFSC